MGAYYNEIDPKAAAWLKELMAAGEIAPGAVDTRSIKDVDPDDLRGYGQHHFFAGIGVWSHALRRAGWPDDQPIWTGSCPCQPFSLAGAQRGFEDPRHLWPDWLRLIRQHRPPVCLGEQVATAGEWLDLVQADWQALGYAFAATDLPAAGFSGAHIRQRLFWVADAHNAEWWTEYAAGDVIDRTAAGWVESYPDPGACGEFRGVGDADLQHQRSTRNQEGSGNFRRFGEAGGLGDTCNARLEGSDGRTVGFQRSTSERAGGPDWLRCRDDTWRPVEPGAFPLAYEAPARVGRLRGYGNALDAEAATQFVSAYMEALW